MTAKNTEEKREADIEVMRLFIVRFNAELHYHICNRVMTQVKLVQVLCLKRFNSSQELTQSIISSTQLASESCH